MNGLWIAVGFLSRLPAPNVVFTVPGLARALFWFPGVGVVLGATWWLLMNGAGAWLDSRLLAFLLVVVGVLFTGALHLDGVADTFDGLSAAAAGKERALAAMKDSRIGAHGAVALVLTALGKFVAFQTLRLDFALVVTLGAATFSRFACALVVAVVKPARSSGLGATFAGADGANGTPAVSRSGLKAAVLGALWLIVPVAGVGCGAASWGALGACVGVASVCGWILVRRCLTVFGGVTGDTHGALIELTETAFLLAGAACSARLQ